jgi:patatin-like phospholipase/acyl hydrolase
LTCENLKKLFKKSCLDKIFGTFQLFPKYSGTIKRNLIKEYFPCKPFKLAEKPVMITGYLLDDHKSRFFKSYENDMTNLVDIVDITTAAPSYFPAVPYIDLENINNDD